MEKPEEKRNQKGGREFPFSLAETKEFVANKCGDDIAEAMVFVKEAENEYLDNGLSERCWTDLSVARFLATVAETKVFIGRCRDDQYAQAQAAELVQKAEDEFNKNGLSAKCWACVNAARQILAEARVKHHKTLAKRTIAEAAEKLATAMPSENGFYKRAMDTLEAARKLLAESEEDERSQVRLLRSAEDEARSASRVIDLLLAEQERQSRNGRRGQDGPATGSRKALEEQGRSLKKGGYDRGAREAERRAKRTPWPVDEE